MSKPFISCCAYQRPVGQGGFYSASISLEEAESDYSLVYDCGSVTDRERLSIEISQFGEELINDKLDLLVLSHLDADHVNGVNELLVATGGVKDVFLPYLSPLERLLCALRFPRASREYYALLRDPVGTLKELGAENVYFVGNGEDNNLPQEGSGNSPRPDDGRYEKDDLRKAKHKKPILKGRNIVLNQKIKDAYEKDISSDSPRSDAKAISDCSDFSISAYWRLRFFQKDGLRESMMRVLSSNDFDARREDKDQERCRQFLQAIQRVLAGTKITSHSILEVLRDRESLSQVRAAYSKIASIHNEVSLCMWHGPEVFENISVQCRAMGVDALTGMTMANIHYRTRYPYQLSWHSRFPGGTIATGDLKLAKKTLEKFKNHYAHEISLTAFMQLPHHGSRYNLELDNHLLDWDRITFVSAGLKNQYLHPHMDLVETLKDQYELPTLWSHERRGVRFEIEVFS